MKQKNNSSYLALIICIFFIFLIQINTQNCTRERCCLSNPCTTSYCIQKNSQTWISTQNFANYQYTKLVLSNNQCKPCSYNCKTCSSESTCSECSKGFYLDSITSNCLLCSDRCLTCTVVNLITKCSSCQDGSYLDSTTLTCKSCPQGAKKCSSSTAIIQCLTGYKKSSNSLYCTSCPSNCNACTVSDTVCSSCSSGYYLNSGLCSKCTISNCITCLRVGTTISCTSCNTGYLLQSGACAACPSNCRTCSSQTICTTCNSGYFLIGGACSTVSTSVANCQTYSGTSTCSSCTSNFYLKNGLCYPCSLLCSSCDGSHFGQCLTCNSNAVLFNKMCLITNFPSTSTYNLFYSFPSFSNLISSGTLSCSNQYVIGTSITINLNNLKAYKLQISWKIYSKGGSTTYKAQISNSGGNSSQSYTTSSSIKFNNLCDNDLSTFYNVDIQKSQNFTSIKKKNTLTFSTDNGVSLALHQIVVTVYRCNQLCIQCSQTLCTECLMTKLYTQDAYCVYSCSNNYYIYLNTNSTSNPKQCLSQCPLGTYTLSSNVSCVTCKAPCLSCLNELFCLSCIDGFYLTKDNTCNQTCPYRYYGKIQTKTCQKCIGRCLQCISEDKCLSCKVGFLNNLTKSCIDSCSFSVTSVNGIYASLNTLYCQSCDTTCFNCLYQKSYCTECSNSTYLFENQCLSQCPNKYYSAIGSNICQSCNYPCKNCQNTSSSCLSCIQGYLYNKTCINDCPSEFYEDNINLYCVPCNSNCLECYGSSNYCLSCKNGYYYFNYTCYSVCPDNYFAQISTGICSQCVNLCKTCINQTYCLSCKSNFLYKGQCLSSGQCPTGYFADIITLSCLPCSAPCIQCQYSASYCTKCNISNPSGLIFLQNNTCKTSCSSLYYYSVITNVTASCELCQQPCLTCLNSTACLSCISGYKYSNNICSSTCSIGTFFNTTLSDCQNCSNNCQICTSSKICQLCKNNFYINSISSTQNQCVSVCPLKYYAQSLSLSCQNCIYPCQTCISSIDCLTCLSGVNYEYRCISSCPDSTYLNVTTNQCVSCLGNCLTCSNDPLFCESCKTGFYLYYDNHTCLVACPSTFYGQQLTKSCLSCPSTCSQCINSTYCTKCILSKSYKSNQSNICVQYCPSGTFGNDLTQTCDTCSSNCLTCKYSSNNCLSCNSGYYYIKLTYNQSDCTLNCPAGYYPQSNYCYQCNFPCKTCSTSAKCLSCVQGTFYHKASSSCLMNCPSDTFYNFTGLSCDLCIYPCQSCDSYSTNCLSCSKVNGSLFFYKGTCITACPSSYYADSSGICNKCYGLCSTCSDKYFCLTCLAGYVYDGFCYSTCPLGTFANTTINNCQTCNSKCTQCILQPNYCTKCSGGLYVYKGNCSVACPTGTYQDNGQCKTCTFPCINCNNLNTCNQCLGGYLLYMNISCISQTVLCPNDFYKMDSKSCVPVTWCPSNYFIDQTLKTCSIACDRKKYTNVPTKKCQSSCSSGWYAGQNLVCKQWKTDPPTSLMAMQVISYIQSSNLYIEVIFNQTAQWVDIQTDMYTFTLIQARLLMQESNIPQYTITIQKPTSLKLKPSTYPERINLNLPAYRVKSLSTNYALQNPSLTINIPPFTAYSNSQIYEGKIMGEFSQGISWFIMLLSFFFLFKNRLSDLYVLWDTVQLLYLLIFLDIQYPPNLNQFFKGLKYTHFTFLPSIFSSDSTRKVSDSPFYAYSFDNSFTRNTGGLFLLIILVFGFFFLLKFCELLIKKVQKVKQRVKQYPSIKSFIYKGIIRYRWHHTSDVFFLTYDFIMLFAFAQINYISFNPGHGFSNALAILACIVYILWVVFVGYKLSKHFKNISKGKMVSNLKCFYRGIQRQNKFGVSMVLIRYSRKLFYCLIIAFFSKNAMFALPILMFSSILMCLFLSINLPYKKKLSNIINIGVQVVLVIMFILIAFINFNDQSFDASIKHNFGWICCVLLAVMIFSLIFEIFCKTMFYLEPQVNLQDKKVDQNQEKMLNDKQKQYLRKKAQQFFDSLLPRLRQRLNLDQDSDDELYNNYEEGDSMNSQNNDQRQRNWNQSGSHNSQQFKHYDNSQNSQDPTAINSKLKINQPPQYLVRCVKDIQ